MADIAPELHKLQALQVVGPRENSAQGKYEPVFCPIWPKIEREAILECYGTLEAGKSQPDPLSSRLWRDW